MTSLHAAAKTKSLLYLQELGYNCRTTQEDSPVLQNPAVMRRRRMNLQANLQANLTVATPHANCNRTVWSPQILGSEKGLLMNYRVWKVSKIPGRGRQKIPNPTYCVCTASACTNVTSCLDTYESARLNRPPYPSRLARKGS